MGILQTAVLAKAVSNKSNSNTSKPTSLKENVVQKPLTWLLVGGIVIYFGSKFLKGKLDFLKNQKEFSAETTTSSNNPFAFDTFLKTNVPPARTNILTAATAYKSAKQVYDALNVYFSEDEDIAIGVFTSLSSQYKVAQVCKAFNDYYKRDILEYLKNGKKTIDVFTGGLSESEYKRVITNVQKKPKF